jgi:hypothetical protein
MAPKQNPMFFFRQANLLAINYAFYENEIVFRVTCFSRGSVVLAFYSMP